MAQVALDIMRPAARTAGHAGAPITVATVTVEVIPLSPDAVARTIAPALLMDQLLYNQFQIVTVDQYGTPLTPCPDIRMGPPGDLLVDRATANTILGTATMTAITATGSQAFTLTPPLPLTAVGDTLIVAAGTATEEAVTLTAWNQVTGVGTATFAGPHAAGAAVAKTTVYVVHGVAAYNDPILGAFLSVRAQVQAQPTQPGG